MMVDGRTVKRKGRKLWEVSNYGARSVMTIFCNACSMHSIILVYVSWSMCVV